MKYILPLIATLCACSVAPEGVSVHDPYEDQNRRVHAFNKAINDQFSGMSGGGDSLVHDDFKGIAVNFADNTKMPGMVLNGLLQGDIGGAGTNAMRFVLNTTIGIGGMFDPADAIGLREEETDFGETLAVWGIPEGAYLELPVLGPSTERAFVGRIVDFLINPLDRYGTKAQTEYGTLAGIAGKVIERGQASETIDSVLTDSADSYAQLRLIYLQNRRFELGTTAEADSVDPYEDLYGDE